MVWCPMLTAQYTLLLFIIGEPCEPGRRRRVLQSFRKTRLEGGSWGLHDHAPPNLFVTALVYVAARLLGVERTDPLVEPARRFLQEEGVLGIPSWGKFWLALLNLYDWRGVNVVLPELWRLPRWIPLHPSNWYCHTRLIYLAMAAIYPHRFQVPVTPRSRRSARSCSRRGSPGWISPPDATSCDPGTSTRGPAPGSGPDTGWRGGSNGSTARAGAPGAAKR